MNKKEYNFTQQEWESCLKVLNEYKNMKVLKKAIGKYMENYNQKRLHSAIEYQTPNEVYFQAVNNPNSKGDDKLPKVS
ncbi:MAG TPA: hypothetical protein EYG73_02580 [Arcobacter sp.]|nr:hypothetical protein [Arcobacter sp.]